MKNFISAFKDKKNAFKIDLVLVITGLATFAAIVLGNISTWSIWFDEAYSWYIIKFNYAEIAHYTSLDVHPPMYYWALKTWSLLFGTSELALRSLSMVSAMVAIVFGFLLIKKLFGHFAARISILFMVLAPMIVRYSQEARMYTMAMAICTAATYVFVTVLGEKDAKKRRKLWIIYAVLVAVGMWTHYFTALIWIAHWLWRGYVLARNSKTFAVWRKKYFSKEWLLTYGLAIALYIPWLPSMFRQLTDIQTTGFWIGKVGTDSFTSYLTNIIFYLSNWRVSSWGALVFFVIIVSLVVLGIKLYRSFNQENRQKYLLVMAIAFVPVVSLFLASMPPFKSSFVERYLLPGILGFSLFAGVTLALGAIKLKPLGRSFLVVILAGSMAFGITQVYAFGNNNNNANYLPRNKQLMQEITKASPEGAVVIADSPYLYYELAYYATALHPVYYLNSEGLLTTGSTVMLYDSKAFAIDDLAAFAGQHKKIWVATQDNRGEIVPLKDMRWQSLKKVDAYDYINHEVRYKATEFLTTSQ